LTVNQALDSRGGLVLAYDVRQGGGAVFLIEFHGSILHDAAQ
jgi:hypothetical protein